MTPLPEPLPPGRYLTCPSCGHWCHWSQAIIGKGLGDNEASLDCPKCGNEMRPLGPGEKG